MSFRRDVFTSVATTVAALACAACGPTFTDGVRAVYSSSQLCTSANVTVKARPDLAPHTVLAGVTPPPGVALDSVGDVYEVSGCNRKIVYVCGHPVVGKNPDPFSAAVSPDGIDMAFNTDEFALFTSHIVEDGRIKSAVVCQASGQTVQ
jgi:hypothetical protein